jgi:hypothetical protein
MYLNSAYRAEGTRARTYTHTHTHARSLTQSLSLSHTHTHTHTDVWGLHAGDCDVCCFLDIIPTFHRKFLTIMTEAEGVCEELLHLSRTTWRHVADFGHLHVNIRM